MKQERYIATRHFTRRFTERFMNRFAEPFKAYAPGVVFSVVLTACGGGQDMPPAGAHDLPGATAEPAAVRLAIAEVETVPFRTRASGSVEPLRRVTPGTKLLGRVAAVAVGEGDRVERGQLLARLESSDLEAAVAQAEAALAMAEAELENARVHHTRMRDLHGRGSVTDKALEDATTGFEIARAAVAQAKANLAAAGVDRGYAEVRSPLAGWVVAKHVEAGDMSAPGAPMFTLEEVSKVKINVSVPEAEVVGLAEGGSARVEVLDRRIDAAIDRIVPAGDPASRTFSVRLLLDNPDGALKSGMFARVSFEHGERRVLRVPPSAVVRRGQLEGLFVVSGSAARKARLRWIKTGRTSAGDGGEARVEILSGLEAGEHYVLAPPPGLDDGEPVTAESVANEPVANEPVANEVAP